MAPWDDTFIEQLTHDIPIEQQHVQTSWLEKPGSPRLLFEWFARYRQAHLEPVGIIDIVSLDRTEYRWDAGVQGYTPQTGSWLVVYRRRG